MYVNVKQSRSKLIRKILETNICSCVLSKIGWYLIVTIYCTQVDFLVWFCQVNLGKGMFSLRFTARTTCLTNGSCVFRSSTAFVERQFWTIFPAVANGCFLDASLVSLTNSNIISVLTSADYEISQCYGEEFKILLTVDFHGIFFSVDNGSSSCILLSASW